MNRAQAPSLSLGISPCPNDTYIFHALLHGLVPCPAALDLHMADVEELNSMVCKKTLDVSKISLGAVVDFMDDYALLSSGAALGWGCGPLVVARQDFCASSLKTATVAIPGSMTTANLLLTLHGEFCGPRKAMLFNQVMPAVAKGDADLGLIIHEGRFTFEKFGLKKVLDLGQWWEAAYGLPLPLGAIAVRRDLYLPMALNLQTAIADSLAYANAHPESSRDFIRAHAQEIDDAVTRAHIRTFVTKYSLDLGETGRAAIEILVDKAVCLTGRKMPSEGLFLPENMSA